MAVATALAHIAEYFFDDFSGDSSKVLGTTSLKDFRTALVSIQKTLPCCETSVTRTSTYDWIVQIAR